MITLFSYNAALKDGKPIADRVLAIRNSLLSGILIFYGKLEMSLVLFKCRQLPSGCTLFLGEWEAWWITSKKNMETLQSSSQKMVTNALTQFQYCWSKLYFFQLAEPWFILVPVLLGMDDPNSIFISREDALKDEKRIKYHKDYLTNLLASIK